MRLFRGVHDCQHFMYFTESTKGVVGGGGKVNVLFKKMFICSWNVFKKIMLLPCGELLCNYSY